MATYKINFTDPLNDEFAISDATSNGPIFPTRDENASTSPQSSTSILLYGKNTPNYGARTDENLVHLMENFAGASSPINPRTGQIWFRTISYWRNTSNNDLYRYVVINDALANTVSPKWQVHTISAGHSVWYDWNDVYFDSNTPDPLPTSAPASPNNGDYFLDGTTVRRFITYNYLGLTQTGGYWLDRISTQRASTPVVPLGTAPNTLFVTPESNMVKFDGLVWEDMIIAAVQQDEPQFKSVGSLWYDTSGLPPTLRVYTDGSPGGWQSIAGDFLPRDGSLPMAGTLDMNNFGITNLSMPSPGVGSDAANRDYVDAAVSGGGSITAASVVYDPVLTLLGGTVQTAIDALWTKSILTDTPRTMAVDLDMGGQTITNLADPLNAQDAATRNWVSTTLAALDAINISFNPIGTTYPLTATDVDSALRDIDARISIIARETGVGDGVTNKWFIPSYIVGQNLLWVFIDGEKQKLGSNGYQFVDFNGVDGTDPTGLTGSTTYTFDIDVDGGGATTLNILGSNALTFTALENEINSLLASSTCVLQYGGFKFTSTSAGVGSSILLTDGAVDPLFAGLVLGGNFVDVRAPNDGTAADYIELGTSGFPSNSVILNTTPALGELVEFLIYGGQ